MIEFSQRELFGFRDQLRELDRLLSNCLDGPVFDEHREKVSRMAVALSDVCEEMDFRSCIATLDDILDATRRPEWTYQEARDLVDRLHGRMLDDFKFPKLLALVDQRSQDLFKGYALFGEEVAARFPSTAYDLEHAGKCLALDEYTASVFHLMRVAERGLHAYAAAFRVRVTDSSTWSQILRDLNQKISARSKAWRKRAGNEEYFMGLWASADAIRAAIRNPTMHLRGKYDDKEAAHIFELVKGFMQRAAERLKGGGR